MNTETRTMKPNRSIPLTPAGTLRSAGWLTVALGVVAVPALLSAAQLPPPLEVSASEPVKYIGTEQPDKRFYDGALRHAVGVHARQVFRANRTHPSEGGRVGWTYNHQPYLAWWNGRFWLQYLSNLKDEHGPPGRTLLMHSRDGRAWSRPKVVFPEYPLPEIRLQEGVIPAGTAAVMHQRMGFYVAPNGRLLTLGFYSYCLTPRDAPNRGQGLGRVVREIRPDGSLGPIYFIRYNRHAGWNESNTRFPFYKTSRDAGFVAACDALLADKLVTLQWWEEDRATDGFYTLALDGEEPKALSYCHRPDGVVLGVWKAQLAALSPDEGRSWTKLARCRTILECNAKTWVQRTDDGRYALVYNHSATRRNRFPLIVLTSEDCHSFDGMLVVHGEVPPLRYQGIHKNLGPQYVRGIVEGNGNPPGDHLWLTYSVNKEDIWVSRVRVPISGKVETFVTEDFDAATTEADLEFWNLYMPQWAPISVIAPPEGGRCLELRDEEPYDYALAERIFPESRRLRVEFRLRVERTGTAALHVELHDRRGARPLRLWLDGEWLAADLGKVKAEPFRIAPRQWLDVRLDVDTAAQRYDLTVNGRRQTQIPFAQPVESLERLVFRTGPWRGDVRPTFVDGQPALLGPDAEDAPGADERVPASVFWVDDVRISPLE